MKDLIEIDKYPVKDVISLLLKDKTTGNNIILQQTHIQTTDILSATIWMIWQFSDSPIVIFGREL